MSVNLPRVSVVIPAYNASGFVQQTLASVFRQTFQGFEVILVNDGSPDTPQLESAIEPHRDRIVYRRQGNRGPGAARNVGIKASRGEYIAFLDADDLWLPEFLESQLTCLTGAKRMDLVYCDSLCFGNARKAGTRWMEHVPSTGEVNFKSLLRCDCVVATSTVLVRRKTLFEAGLFDEEFSRSGVYFPEDYDLWLRIAYHGGRMSYQRKVLGLHRVHDDSLTAAEGSTLEGQIVVLKKLRRELQLSPRVEAIVEDRILECKGKVALVAGKKALIEKRYQEARSHFRRANAILRRPQLRCAVWALGLAPEIVRTVYQWKRQRLEKV